MQVLVTILLYALGAFVLGSGLWFELKWHFDKSENKRGFFEPGGPLNGHMLLITGAWFLAFVPMIMKILF